MRRRRTRRKAYCASRRAGTDDRGCPRKLRKTTHMVSSGVFRPNVPTGGTGMLSPPLVSLAALMRASRTSGGRRSNALIPPCGIPASRNTSRFSRSGTRSATPATVPPPKLWPTRTTCVSCSASSTFTSHDSDRLARRDCRHRVSSAQAVELRPEMPLGGACRTKTLGGPSHRTKIRSARVNGNPLLRREVPWLAACRPRHATAVPTRR